LTAENEIHFSLQHMIQLQIITLWRCSMITTLTLRHLASRTRGKSTMIGHHWMTWKRR